MRTGCSDGGWDRPRDRRRVHGLRGPRAPLRAAAHHPALHRRSGRYGDGRVAARDRAGFQLFDGMQGVDDGRAARPRRHAHGNDCESGRPLAARAAGGIPLCFVAGWACWVTGLACRWGSSAVGLVLLAHRGSPVSARSASAGEMVTLPMIDTAPGTDCSRRASSPCAATASRCSCRLFQLLPTAPFHIHDLGGITAAVGAVPRTAHLLVGVLGSDHGRAGRSLRPHAAAARVQPGNRRVLEPLRRRAERAPAARPRAHPWHRLVRLAVGLGRVHRQHAAALRRAEGIGYWGMSSVIALAVGATDGFWIYSFGWFWLCMFAHADEPGDGRHRLGAARDGGADG